MKKSIHPQYFKDAIITCSSCGAEFKVGATKENLNVESCSQCHPEYTGKKKIIDSTGRVDRFRKLQQKAQEKKQVSKTSKTKEEKRKEKQQKQQSKTKTLS